MKTKKIEIPIFTGTLIIHRDKDLKAVSKKYKTKSLEAYGAVSLRGESPREYIVAFEGYDPSLIAHEVVHVVNFIFLDCGQELDRVNDEAQAYLTGWVFEQIYNFV